MATERQKAKTFDHEINKFEEKYYLSSWTFATQRR